jgi:hypothetical protein
MSLARIDQKSKLLQLDRIHATAAAAGEKCYVSVRSFPKWRSAGGTQPGRQHAPVRERRLALAVKVEDRGDQEKINTAQH